MSTRFAQVGVADRFQQRNRQHKADWATAFIDTHGIRSILFVGVGGPPRRQWEGLIETQLAERVPRAVWSGLSCQGREDRPLVIADGLRLPFADQSFDLVYSNAVIEHVGDEAAQRTFLDEHRRVGRHWIATTPNRWFPVESHTRTVLRHWHPGWRAGRSEFARLLSRRELARLCDHVEGTLLSPTFIGWGGTPSRAG